MSFQGFSVLVSENRVPLVAVRYSMWVYAELPGVGTMVITGCAERPVDDQGNDIKTGASVF